MDTSTHVEMPLSPNNGMISITGGSNPRGRRSGRERGRWLPILAKAHEEVGPAHHAGHDIGMIQESEIGPAAAEGGAALPAAKESRQRKKKPKSEKVKESKGNPFFL
jgi:hypothetical protein